MAAPEEIARVRRYYASAEHAERQHRIARGDAMPRILCITCRWTTVLKHVCDDFRRGFERLGCSTETIIERSDVESLTHGVFIEALDRFRPDIVFGVSHARPSYAGFPEQLPVVCFFMDRCGPLLELERLDGAIRPADVFCCILREFERFLHGKGVPRDQTFVMATPSDPELYRPLPAEDPLLARYRADVSWVKHRGSTLEEFLAQTLPDAGDPFANAARRVFRRIHERVARDPARQWLDADVAALGVELAAGELPASCHDRLRPLVTRYMIQVYSSSFREHFLLPLREADLRLKLHGNDWRRHPQLGRFAAGPVEKGDHLNAVYNATAVNLHLHHEATMHQRIVEGAMAGAFFLANRLSAGRDGEPVTDYFEDGREIVLVDSPGDLLEKCRYYVAHADERQAIAARMRERALREHTLEQAADRVLDAVRQRLGA